MANLSDVETSFYNLIVSVLEMPLGYQMHTIATSARLGYDFRIYRGWPMDKHLQVDLRAGVTNISIFSADGVAVNTSQVLRQMTTVMTSRETPTMTAVVSGKTVTFAGTPSISELIGVGIITHGWSYRLQVTDTPTTVAALFAANIPGATSVGPVLTLATNHQVTVGYGGDATISTEMGRQEQVMRISIWAPTTEKRDIVCGFLDSAILFASRFLFPDRSLSGPIKSAGTHVDDKVGIEEMWRRDLMYCIEYATTFQEIQPTYVLGHSEVPLIWI